MRRTFLYAFLSGLLFWNAPLSAQVFAPQSSGAGSKNTSAQSSKKDVYESAAAAEKKENNSFSASSATKNSQRPSYVKTDFSRTSGTPEKAKKYDNSQRKVYSFKIVDGDVVFDKDEDRSILISYDNFEIKKSFDSLIRCSIRLYVLNDFKDKITNFSFQLHWPDISTSVEMNRLNPGVRTYKDIMLLGDGCLNLDKTPTIEINRCRVKGKTQEECADAVKWFKLNKRNP